MSTRDRKSIIKVLGLGLILYTLIQIGGIAWILYRVWGNEIDLYSNRWGSLSWSFYLKHSVWALGVAGVGLTAGVLLMRLKPVGRWLGILYFALMACHFIALDYIFDYVFAQTVVCLSMAGVYVLLIFYLLRKKVRDTFLPEEKI